MKVWRMVKKRLPFFGTPPFLAMSAGAMRTMASSGKALKALQAWSARKRMRGRREGSRVRFQRLWKSFQAIWRAMKVLPVPVARVRRTRCRSAPMASMTASTAASW